MGAYFFRPQFSTAGTNICSTKKKKKRAKEMEGNFVATNLILPLQNHFFFFSCKRKGVAAKCKFAIANLFVAAKFTLKLQFPTAAALDLWQ